MSAKITEEYMAKAQRLIRQVLLVNSDIGEIEKRLARIKEESSELYKKLDDMADGEDTG